MSADCRQNGAVHTIRRMHEGRHWPARCNGDGCSASGRLDTGVRVVDDGRETINTFDIEWLAQLDAEEQRMRLGRVDEARCT